MAAKKSGKKAVGKKKYSAGASEKVAEVMHEQRAGTLRSGRSKKKVTSRKQAIAIGLSEARAAGQKVPKKGARSGKKAANKDRVGRSREARSRSV